jgi:small subunit ribosomal protein S6
MKNRYEALLVLNTKGKEDSAKEIIERIEKLLAKEGATVEQVQRLDSRKFAYVAGSLDHGYYVNVIFQGEAGICEKITAKLDFDEDVYRQHYLRLKAKKPAEQAA